MCEEKRDLKSRIYVIISEVLKRTIDPQEYDEDTKLEALGFNSMNFVKLGVILEEEFQIRFTLTELSFDNSMFSTIESLIDAVSERK